MRSSSLHNLLTTGLLLMGGLLALSVPVPVVAQQPSQPIYPLREGSEWIYQAGAFELSERITGFDEIGGERCARVETRMNGQLVASEHIAIRRDGVYRVAIAGDPVTPALCFLKFPAPRGTRWAVQSKIQDAEVSGQFTLGTDIVELPTGKYQAVTSHGTEFEAAGKKLEFTYYFVPGIGKVRQIVSVDGQSTELLLKEFRPGS